MTMTKARRRNRGNAEQTLWTTIYRLVATRFLPPGDELDYPENERRPTLDECADYADKAMDVRKQSLKLQAENKQLKFNLHEAYDRIELLKRQVLELELAVAKQPE